VNRGIYIRPATAPADEPACHRWSFRAMRCGPSRGGCDGQASAAINESSTKAQAMTITEHDVGNGQMGHNWPVNFNRHSIRSQTVNFRRGGRGRIEGISLTFLINPFRRSAASRYMQVGMQSGSTAARICEALALGNLSGSFRFSTRCRSLDGLF